jgi:hypothetical protein
MIGLTKGALAIKAKDFASGLSRHNVVEKDLKGEKSNYNGAC